ncbi:MAG: EAL domain-containing protein [Clostridium sp.]|nr:EAL domain-containing protein [Clostridium sp.]MCM1547447.1 EAL domain-containing protein [Ruminococcus sp.]
MNYNSRRYLRKKNKKGYPFFLKLIVTMMIITILQLAVFVSVLLFGGEFSYIRKYAYNNFIERNINRKNGVETFFIQKAAAINGAAAETAAMIDRLLKENGVDADEIRYNKQLNSEIISESADMLVSLIRQNMVNDVYIFLDSGSLFSSDEEKKLNGIYIRDIDPNENNISNNEDLLMEIGSSSVASRLGITLDFEWAGQLDVTDVKNENFDFYFKTIETARHSTSPTVYELGYWSGFSRISRSATESIKYTVPLISETGDIYGVVGMGLTEKLIRSRLPASDSTNKNECYILAADHENSGEYITQMYMGAFYSRIKNDLKINEEQRIEGNIYNLTDDSGLRTVGNIQQMKLYNSASPYKSQKWAFVSIGDEREILTIYNELLKMFLISSVVSFVITFIGTIIINGRMAAPISKMIKTLDRSSAESGDIIRFSPSKIREVDRLGNAITRLQIDVSENASRVSKIIGMLDMGIGVFLYDRENKSVYLSESVVKLLGFTRLPKNRDVTISFEDFRKYLSSIDIENKICSNKIFHRNENTEYVPRTDIKFMYYDAEEHEVWLKFSFVPDKRNVICLVQDITAAVQEKRHIEFERDYDITTGLLNRRAYLNKLDELFEKPDELKTAAIIMTDLDNLKYVNDTYGHDFGDDYIRAAANVLKEFTKYGGIVSRLSGDEFNVFLYGYESKEAVRSVINEVGKKLNESFCMLSDGTKYKVKASRGVAWYPDHSQSYDMLMKYADFAMYTIKHTTKGSIAEFNENEYRKDSILITGVEEMNRIIDDESIKFAFQTIISAANGEIFGFEVLMRPQSEILKAPIDFIRVAKTSSKLYAIERLTWIKGLKAFDEQIKKGNIPRNSRVFLNSISNCIITKENMNHIEINYPHLLQKIILEILEGEAENETYTAQKLDMLGRWGAEIALDDFGTGYNSEFLFLKIKPNLIKIDRSIISGCDKDKNKISIINNLVKLVHTNGALTLAEGVETSEELKCVIKCGVDLIQGFYVARPVFDPKPVRQEIIDEIIRYNENE